MNLTREAFTQLLYGRCLFLLTNLLILLLVRGSLQPLPRQAAPQEVHKYVTERFQVISPRLF